MGKFFTFVLLVCICCADSGARAQLVQYQIGGPGNELAIRVKYIPADGSTIIAGYTYDIASGVATNHKNFILKVTSAGTIAWQKTFGIAGTDNLIGDMIITHDGNIVVAGTVGRSSFYSGNIAALLKFNSATGSLMWQSCLKDTMTTPGGEYYSGVTEMGDGRIVAVGSYNNGPSSGASLICVFKPNGTLLYDEVDDIADGDDYEAVTTSADGNSVYLVGMFVSDFKDIKVIKYTPDSTSGTANWEKDINYVSEGTLSDNIPQNVVLSGGKLIVKAVNIFAYSLTNGESNSIISMNAADGSGIQIRTIQNSGAQYANSVGMGVVSPDHIFTVQNPFSSFLDAAVFIPGVATEEVITEVTSLSAGTANAPIRLSSSSVVEHSVMDMDIHDTTLYMAGGANLPGGFGGNDVYFVSMGNGPAGTGIACDTTHDIVTIEQDSVVMSSAATSIFSFTPAFVTVDTGNAAFSISIICGSALPLCDTVLPGIDTTMCLGNTMAIGVPDSAGTNYLWNTGSTDSSINVSDSGTYIVTASRNGCNATTHIHVAMTAAPMISLGPDTTICRGDTIGLGVTETVGERYLWSTGSTNSSINVVDSGSYILITSEHGCKASDTIHVAMTALPGLNIGQDTTLCPGQEIVLTAGPGIFDGMWSDGTRGQTLSVTQAGVYWAMESNICGIARDTMVVTVDMCDLWFPSAFTPNDDGLNDIARARGSFRDFSDYSLSIFNRFGQLVYYTENIYDGWDGKFNGTRQDVGTYYYMINYVLQERTHMMKGDLALIR